MVSELTETHEKYQHQLEENEMLKEQLTEVQDSNHSLTQAVSNYTAICICYDTCMCNTTDG